MDNPKTEVIQAIKDAQNVLVTVSKDPSIDQLAAAIGMTLVLNKLGKHGTAVFSGNAPSTIEFLKPENTLERNTDSLRDFIISLDKSKADKLRYKVEDQHVKIFITPYRTTISENDLVFSHGDFNVDVVLALGVHEQTQLDQAITAHGRILHDAKIISVNVDKPGQLGGVNYNEQASSLSEVMSNIALQLKSDVFDSQTATALLTGIVAETDRFSNDKTKPETMTVSAKLMAAGADQQLVATKLQVVPEEPAVPEESAIEEKKDQDSSDQDTADAIKHADGSLDIKHDQPKSEEQAPSEIHVDDEGNFKSSHEEDLPEVEPSNNSPQNQNDENKEEPGQEKQSQRMILEPPSNSGTLTASGKEDERANESSDPLSLPPVKGPLLSHTPQNKNSLNKPKVLHNPPAYEPYQPVEQEAPTHQPEPVQNNIPQEQPAPEDQTLASLEKSVDSPHVTSTNEESAQTDNNSASEQKSEDTQVPDVADLQDAVDKALAQAGDQEPLDPIAALNANPIDLNLTHDDQDFTDNTDAPSPEEDDYLDVTKLDVETGLPAGNQTAPQTEDKPKFPPDPTPAPSTDASNPASAPPPVPPPMMPPMPNNNDDNQTLPPVPQQ